MQRESVGRLGVVASELVEIGRRSVVLTSIDDVQASAAHSAKGLGVLDRTNNWVTSVDVAKVAQLALKRNPHQVGSIHTATIPFPVLVRQKEIRLVVVFEMEVPRIRVVYGLPVASPVPSIVARVETASPN